MLTFFLNLPAFAAQAIGALFIMAVSGLLAAGFGIADPQWTGAAAAAFFYYGREVTQYQVGLSIRLRTARAALWHRGWFFWEWGSITKVLECLCPATVCALAALIVERI